MPIFLIAKQNCQATGAGGHTYDEEIEKIGDQRHTQDPYLLVAVLGQTLLSQVGQCEQSQPQ